MPVAAIVPALSALHPTTVCVSVLDMKPRLLPVGMQHAYGSVLADSSSRLCDCQNSDRETDAQCPCCSKKQERE